MCGKSHVHATRDVTLLSERGNIARSERGTPKTYECDAMAHIYSSDRLDEQLVQLLNESDPRIRVYVYRMIDNRKIKPALYVGRPFEDLESYIRDKFGGGLFYIMIRRGEIMLLAGTIAFELPLSDPRRRQNELNSPMI